MRRRRPNRAEPPGPWVRALVALVTLGMAAYGVSCVIRGRLVSEGVVLEGARARVVGATIAALAAVTLARTLYPRGRKPSPRNRFGAGAAPNQRSQQTGPASRRPEVGPPPTRPGA